MNPNTDSADMALRMGQRPQEKAEQGQDTGKGCRGRAGAGRELQGPTVE